MTTIAWDGYTLASDSRCTDANILIGDNTQKLYVLPDENPLGIKYIAICGDLDQALAVVSWLMGSSPRPKKLDDFGALGVTAGGVAYWIGSRLGLSIAAVPTALGTGDQVALAHMKIGFTAEEAVEVASTVDLCTGGDIQIIKAKQRPTKKGKKS
jgi:hypothetical protein